VRIAPAVAMAYQRSLRERAFVFAQQLLSAHDTISRRGPQFAHMANQLFRSGSAIGALLEEGDVANSRRDMGAKHAIALREAKESRYWLRLIIAANVEPDRLAPLEAEANEFVAMLTTSVRKLRDR
jgi:four helix bundle protein